MLVFKESSISLKIYMNFMLRKISNNPKSHFIEPILPLFQLSNYEQCDLSSKSDMSSNVSYAGKVWGGKSN